MNKIAINPRSSSIRPARPARSACVIPEVSTRRTVSVPHGLNRYSKPSKAHLPERLSHSDDPFSVLQSYSSPHCSGSRLHDYSPHCCKNENYLAQDSPRTQTPNYNRSTLSSVQLLQDLNKEVVSLQDQMAKLMRGQELFANETVFHFRLISDSISSIIAMQTKSFERFTEGLLEATQKLNRLEAAVDSLKETNSQKEGIRSLSPKLSPHYPRFIGSQ